MSRTCLARYTSPLGEMTLASADEALAGVWFAGQRYEAEHVELREAVWADSPTLRVTRAWLDAYFAGSSLPPPPPLAPMGSAFRQAVWRLLLHIPYGETTTYGQLARLLREEGIAASAQAVGGAVGHNPISIIIPCHRVLASTGALTGYAAGTDKKQWLLLHEARTAQETNNLPIH